MAKNGFGKFLTGALIGVGLGVLFAPKSGKETRKELKEKCDELINKVKELDAKEVKEAILKKIDDIKTELADLDKEKVIAIAKEKASNIKKKLDDLYNTCKEKTTPVVTKAVEDVRTKTVEVLKGAVDKLEKQNTPKVKTVK